MDPQHHAVPIAAPLQAHIISHMVQLLPQRQHGAGGRGVVADHLGKVAHGVRHLIFPVQCKLSREHVQGVVDEVGIDLQEKGLQLGVLISGLLLDIFPHQHAHPVQNPVELFSNRANLIPAVNRQRPVEVVPGNALHIVPIPAQPGYDGANQRIEQGQKQEGKDSHKRQRNQGIFLQDSMLARGKGHPHLQGKPVQRGGKIPHRPAGDLAFGEQKAWLCLNIGKLRPVFLIQQKQGRAPFLGLANL